MEGKGGNGRAPQVVQEESAACSKTTILELEHLPKELVKTILEKLVGNDPEPTSYSSRESWDSNFRSVMAYRQVCSVWRDFLDEILEQKILSMISAWVPPFRSSCFIPPSTAKFRIRKQTSNGLEEKIPYPSSLINYNGSNPFPAKTLSVAGKFHYDADDDDDAVRTQSPTISVIDLIVKYAHHLSVLYLNNLEIVDFDVLVTILETSVNLKALVLRDLIVSKEMPPRPLPALQHLKIMLIENFFVAAFLNKAGEDLNSLTQLCHQWLVEPYAGQLVQLERTNISFPLPTSVTVPLPNLKQLTLSYPKLIVLQQNGPAVSLQRLCLNIAGGNDWMGNVYWSDLITEASGNDEVEEDDEVQQQKRRDPLMEKLQRVFGKLPTFKVKFPHLKKFAFPYPQKEIHVMLLSQTILPKFPALEELLFLHFDQTLSGSRNRSAYEHAGETIRQFLESEDYWTICPKLKKITVVENYHSMGDRFAFSCSRPLLVVNGAGTSK